MKAERGEVDEAAKLMDEVEKLQMEKEETDAELKQHVKGGNVSQQQKLRVCDVCSSYLSVYDTDQRLADHFAGKQHMGYVQIREKIDKLRKSRPTQYRNDRNNDRPRQDRFDSRDRRRW
jgi:RNA-binding protein Luc7-like 2